MQRRRALDVATGLDSLSDHDVRPGVGRRPGLLGISDLHQHDKACLSGSLDQLPVDTPREGHESGTFLDHHLEALALVEVEHEVDAELPAHRRANRRELLAERVWARPRRCERPERTDTADGRHELGRGRRPDRSLHHG
jgi:hypothetical protein